MHVCQMTAAMSSSKNKTNNATTVFVRFSPPDTSVTRLHLQSYFSNIGPVKKCSVIRQKKPGKEAGEEDAEKSKKREGKGYGFVKFTNTEDAKQAKDALDNSKMGVEGREYRVFVELASDVTSSSSIVSTSGANDQKIDEKERRRADPEEPKEDEIDKEALQLAKHKRTSRVILRNLSFYAREFHIQTTLEKKFGPILNIELPLVPSSSSSRENNKFQQHRGFAFVTFQNEKDAKKAVESGAGVVKIKKRPVAIDFSVSKVQHKRIRVQEELEQEDEEEMDEEDLMEEMEKKKEQSEESEEDSSSSSDSDSDEESEEDSDDDNNDAKENDNDDDDASTDSNTTSSSSSSDIKEETPPKEQPEPSSKPKKEIPEIDPDITTHKTIFIRNIPFDATRHDLFTLFRTFGKITGIYLVKDKNTGIHKGTAFLHYASAGAAHRALKAAADGINNENNGVEDRRKSVGGDENNEEHGLHLNGRRIYLNLAVDKSTASTFTPTERDEEGNLLNKPTTKKDRRYLYLKNEGRVADKSGSGGTTFMERGNAWEDLPQSDILKRERAHQEKHTKLRSPLFFVNPKRLSLRNLAKHVTEVELKSLMVESLKRGLLSLEGSERLVSVEDVVAYWRAGGTMTERDIAFRVARDRARKNMPQITENDDDDDDEEEEGEEAIIPPFDEKDVKKYIPSVFIDRDFESLPAAERKNKSHLAPSRGFGFVEFTHHVHALACLRELNNNPRYSAMYAAGGKKAMEMKGRRLGGDGGGAGGKRGKKRRGKKGGGGGEDGGMEEDGGGDDDGRVRIPRLIVEFTVENKAKAKQQAERRAQQLANVQKQRLAKKESMLKAKTENEDDTSKTKKKKKGRGALQREKKRKLREEGGDDDEENENKSEKVTERASGKNKSKDKSESLKNNNDDGDKATAVKKKKGIKPPKKRKVDKEEEAFESMVRSYKEAFSGGASKKKKASNQTDSTAKAGAARENIVKKRWFE